MEGLMDNPQKKWGHRGYWSPIFIALFAVLFLFYFLRFKCIVRKQTLLEKTQCFNVKGVCYKDNEWRQTQYCDL